LDQCSTDQISLIVGPARRRYLLLKIAFGLAHHSALRCEAGDFGKTPARRIRKEVPAALRAVFPDATIFYAVKANPAAEVIAALAELGCIRSGECRRDSPLTNAGR